MDAYNTIKFILLILALPAQYYISQNWSNDSNEQSLAVQSLHTTLSDFKDSYFNLESWKKWYISFVTEKPTAWRGGKSIFNKKNRKNGPTKSFDYDIALEVLNYRKMMENYGESAVTRSPRPSKVLFRVGQVVRHKIKGFYGVIIGWDATAQIERDAFENEELHNLEQPHYLILMDQKHTGKYENKYKYYIAQDELQLVYDVEIENHLTSTYFEGYENGVYWSSKYLKTVYPDDQ